MNISQIAERLNVKALDEGFKISSLPEMRKKYLGKKKLPSQIFTNKTIFDDEDVYAFHYGGRDEIQFNIGSDYISDEKASTRVALCFSLEPSRSLPDPVGDLEPFKIRFNDLIDLHPEYFDGFKMWYYQNEKRYGNFKPQKIPNSWFQRKTFIALGTLIDKSLEDLKEKDFDEVLHVFDKLLPIYQYCVLQNPLELFNEKRIVKLCWNENEWIYPSGKYGKSKDVKSHENERGYGHEEWLFDIEKLIDGYHYAFLQSAQHGRENFLSSSFDIRLFSHNSETKENLWIGSIRNLEVISNNDAMEIYAKYEDNGWIDEMKHQIKAINGDIDNFIALEPKDRFNVRFRPEDTILDKPFGRITNFKSIIGTYRHQFVHDTLDTQIVEKHVNKKREFKFTAGKADKSLRDRISTRQKREVQSEPLHDKIQEVLYEILVEIYGEENVGMETDTGLSTRIDVSVNSVEGIILYEVKSYPSVMNSIRAALGQLIEYAYFPYPISNLKEIIIVSHIPINPECREYLELIRNTSSLEVYYQSVDKDKRTISLKS